jgi:TP901 family phage tail tape measure protein
VGITARDLYFVLRAQNMTSAVFTGVSRDLLRIGAAAQASSARAQAAALKQQAESVKAMAAQKIAADETAAANLRAQAQQLRSAGATKQQTAQLYAQAQAYDKHAAQVKKDADQQVAQLNRTARAWDNEAKSLEASYRKHQQMSQTLRDLSSVLTILGLALIGVGAVGAAALLSTVKAAQEYQRQVALTMTQVDGFKTSLKQLGDIGIRVASQIAVPFDQMQSTLYDIFSSTNANIKQATLLLTAFSMASVAGQVSLQDAGRSTMQIMNAFRIPFEKVNQVLDTQFQLVRKGVGTYAEFSSVIGRAVPSAVRAGQSIQTLDAMLVFLTRNGLSAAMSAASAARALDALSNPKAVANMEALGIKVKDLHGNFLPLVDILGQLSAKIGSLPDVARSKAISDLFKGAGGTIQALRFLNQVIKPEQYKQFVQFLGDMNNATGSFEQAYSQMANTTASKSQLLKNNWQILKVTIGQELLPQFTKLIGALAGVMQAFNKLPDSTKHFLIQGAFITTIIAVITGGILLLLGVLGMLASGLAALGIGLGTVTAIIAGSVIAIAALALAFRSAWKEGGSFRDLVYSIRDAVVSAWDRVVVPTAKRLADAFNNDLKPALDHIWMVIQLNVIPIITDMVHIWKTKLVPAAQELWNWLVKVADKGFKLVSDAINNYLIPALNQATDFYYKHKTGIDQVISRLIELAKWISKVAGSAIIGALVVAILALIVAIATAIRVVTTLVSWITTLIHWISIAVDWFRRVNDASNVAGNGIRNGIMNGILGAIAAISQLPGRIRAAMGNLGSILYNAGVSIISGLISGIRSKIGELISTLSAIGSLIPNIKGPPAKDRKLLLSSGKLIMQGLIAGIDSLRPSLEDKLAKITKQMPTSVDANVSVARPVVSAQNRGPVGRVITNHITINTQAITPRLQAEQLGMLLAGRIG